MSASTSDIQLASLAAGFTLGFGFLTVWEAMKQTRRNRNPLRSSYIYMMWGEIIANIAIGIIGWLFLGGVLGPTVPVLFFILFLWVFQIQLLMQIIINRIAVIAESGKIISRMKWGTAAIITLINIAVFCIWIPAHTVPPVSQTFVTINRYWDRTSKVLILLVDAGLNWYFLRTVKTRLLSQHGLMKYKPLVAFNAKLMIISIGMDAMLIGLMSLPNQVVYIQFHPVAYMVKLNIEMSMASLITHLAQDRETSFNLNSTSQSQAYKSSGGVHHKKSDRDTAASKHLPEDGAGITSKDHELEAIHNGASGIHRRFDVEVRIDSSHSIQTDNTSANTVYKHDDQASLTRYAGRPGSFTKP